MNYKAEEIHIICTDPRIQKLYHDYLVENSLFGKFDTIQHENPILDFLDPDKFSGMINRIKAYIKLHGPTKIVLIDHFDCGAYKLGGYNFEDDAEEGGVHEKNNQKVISIIKNIFLGMEVEIKCINITGEGCEWLENPEDYF